MFQTVVEYALSFLSKLREKETLKASLWKYLKKFSIKKFYQTMVFRVQFSTLVATELKHHRNVIVTGRWQTPKKDRYAFVMAAAEKITLFPNPVSNCPKTSLLPTMFSIISFCSDFNSLTECPFLVFFGATDGNFMEKYNVTPSWQRTSSWQKTGVGIVSCRSADFNIFYMTYKNNSVSSEDFGLLKFPWKKAQHSESRYANDLRHMFVVTSSSPP